MSKFVSTSPFILKVLPSITNDALPFVPVVAEKKSLTYLHRQLLSDLLNCPAPKFDKVGKSSLVIVLSVRY